MSKHFERKRYTRHTVSLDLVTPTKLFDADVLRQYLNFYCGVGHVKILFTTDTETPNLATIQAEGVEIQRGVMWEPQAIPTNAIWVCGSDDSDADPASLTVYYSGTDPI